MTEIGIEDIGDELSPKQKLFCEYYVNGDKELFGNGVQSYIEAYGPDRTSKNWYKTACQSASRLLTNVKVIAYINQLLDEGGLNDTAVDKQLSFLIAQHADFGSKVMAIREYNKLKQRITDKVDLTTKGDKIDSSDSIKDLTQKLNELYRSPGSSGDGEPASAVGGEAQD